jgi:hypothetical protein
MRLIVHAGLHETGSTHLQHIMNDNHEALLGRGVYYEKQSGEPGHHRVASAILRRDPAPLVAMVEAARAAGCHALILSSEDLEAMIFDRPAAAGIEQAAAASGVDRIEWHICLRDPGEYFSSLFAQLQRHVYTDPAAMLCEILREGMMLIVDPLPGRRGAPFWGFCFDHLRYISAFAAQTAHPVYLHDVRDAAPFPGWRILDRLGLLDALRVLPGQAAGKAPMSEAQVQAGYSDQILRLLPGDAQRERLRPMIAAQVRGNAAAGGEYAGVVAELFSPGMAAALQIFACPGLEGQEPLRACA